MKFLAEIEWNDIYMDWGYTYSEPYQVKWFVLPSGNYLRLSSPWRTHYEKTWYGRKEAGRKLSDMVSSVPMTYDEIFSDMINKGLLPEKVSKIMKNLGDRGKVA